MTIIDKYAEFSDSTSLNNLSQETIKHAKRAVIDYFAATYAGSKFDPCKILLQEYKSELSSNAPSRIIGHSSYCANPELAAWINGTSSHTAEYDDIFRDALFHPSSPIISAALATADWQKSKGEDFLKAIVYGFEISTRLGSAIQPSHGKFFHSTGTVGCIGAAAASAYLLMPNDVERIKNALSTSVTFFAGLQQAFKSDSMSKPLHAGHAAEMGIRSARAARSGITGASNIIDGSFGMGFAMSLDPKWNVATQGLGEVFNITQASHKIHACCGLLFPAIDAAVHLRNDEKFRIDNISKIEVFTYLQAIEALPYLKPKTFSEAKFSVAYTVCEALIRGCVDLDSFTQSRLNDLKLNSLIDKVIYTHDESYQNNFPSKRESRVEITFDDGKTINKHVPYRKGDPELPLTDDELIDKFHRLSSAVIGSNSEKLVKQVLSLDSIYVSELSL